MRTVSYDITDIDKDAAILVREGAVVKHPNIVDRDVLTVRAELFEFFEGQCIGPVSSVRTTRRLRTHRMPKRDEARIVGESGNLICPSRLSWQFVISASVRTRNSTRCERS